MTTPNVYPYPSKSQPGTIWHVSEHAGAYDCDCRGLVRARRAQGSTATCEHIREQKRKDAMTTPKLDSLPNEAAVVSRLALGGSSTLAANDAAVELYKGGEQLPAGYEPLELRPRMVVSEDIDTCMRLAVMAYGAGMLPDTIKSAEAACAVMLRGVELGMPPLAACARLYVVNNKVEMETQVMIGLVRVLDPTAQFVFERYGADGCTVALYRRGVLQIRVSYLEVDRARAHQGEKQEGEWRNGQNGKRFFEPKLDANKQPVYSADPASPWTKYPQDMFAYAACKRACRLGAPDAINMIGTTRSIRQLQPYPMQLETVAGGDEPFAPRNALTEAIVSGETSMAAVAGADPDPDTREAIETTTPATKTAATDTKPADKAAATGPALALDAPADPAVVDGIAGRGGLLERLKQSIDLRSYTAFLKGLKADFMGGESAKWDSTKLTRNSCEEIIKRIRAFEAGGAPPDDEPAGDIEGENPVEQPSETPHEEGEYRDIEAADTSGEEQRAE